MITNAFFLGKGGVGKTTTSAAFALALSRAGKRVLVVSLDPAHNLGDVLGLGLSEKPSEVEEGLTAMEIDLSAWVDRYLADCRQELIETYAYNATLNVDSFFDILRYAPGTEEYAVLWAIDHIRCDLSGNYDCVVYDTPPTALALRFLAMPTVCKLWVDELTQLRRRILRQRSTVVRLNPESPVAASCVDPADDKVYGKLRSIRGRLDSLGDLFGRESYIAIVVNPDILSVSEALRIEDELKRIKLPLSAICLNKRVEGTVWELDPRLNSLPLFQFESLPDGLRTREDLTKLDTSALVNSYTQAAGIGE